uniref:Uncharacterized protein TCIL3000_11_5920 n=1 Tax=Trypanosoma congolense (strain IL3000) TaxID=1068625 RepID=G0V0K5_TRYCI|nr:unnamed protein product [Trypanosoma congolense IL3000]
MSAHPSESDKRDQNPQAEGESVLSSRGQGAEESPSTSTPWASGSTIRAHMNSRANERRRNRRMLHDGSCFNAEGSGNGPHSFLVDFIDQCIHNKIPETFIVEYVSLIVNAMQEEIKLSNEIHNRQKDGQRLEKTETIINGKNNIHLCTHHVSKHTPSSKTDHTKQHEKPTEEDAKVENDKTLNGANSNPKNGGSARCNPHTSQDVNAAREQNMSAKTGREGGNLGKIGSATKRVLSQRNSREVSTQTAQPMPLKTTPRGSLGAGPTGFRSFMRPTDASNRKERLKYGQGVDDKVADRNVAEKNPRLSARKVGSSPNKGSLSCCISSRLPCRMREDCVDLTWSDDDVTASCAQCPNTSMSATNPQSGVHSPSTTNTPSRINKSANIYRDQRSGASEVASPPSKQLVSGRRAAVTVKPLGRYSNMPYNVVSPPASISTPRFFPNPQLQTYVERSQRKLRESLRFLDSTSGGVAVAP